MKNILLITIFAFLLLNCNAQLVTDFDGNGYHTVNIGTQKWLLENLNATHYRNGDSIGTTHPASLYITYLTSPKYQWAYDGNENNVSTYGRLYTWYAAIDTRGVCPSGWHVSTDNDWKTLTTYLGGDSVAGSKLKETGTTHWQNHNAGATNKSGFTALPGGYRYNYGTCFFDIDFSGNWWSSTDTTTDSAWGWTINGDIGDSGIGRINFTKSEGFSVRCIMDTALSENIVNSHSNTNEISIYPNPLKDKLYIKNVMSSNSFLYILNLQGKLISYKQNTLNFLDISNLKNGIYIIKIVDSGKTMIAKFVKE